MDEPIVIGTPRSIRSCGHDEYWLQDQIADSPIWRSETEKATSTLTTINAMTEWLQTRVFLLVH